MRNNYTCPYIIIPPVRKTNHGHVHANISAVSFKNEANNLKNKWKEVDDVTSLEHLTLKAYNISIERPDFFIDYCVIPAGQPGVGTCLSAPDEVMK
jgi:hypothetical protein